jgi:spore maturation protein SpmA
MTLNYVWIGFLLIGFVVGVFKAFVLGQTGLLSEMLTALFDAAKNGFEISIGLAGIMSLWLGIMNIGERAGVSACLQGWCPHYSKPCFVEYPKKALLTAA